MKAIIDSVQIDGRSHCVVGGRVYTKTCAELVQQDSESYPGPRAMASLRDIAQAQPDTIALDDGEEYFCSYERNNCVRITRIADPCNVDEKYQYGGECE